LSVCICFDEQSQIDIIIIIIIIIFRHEVGPERPVSAYKATFLVKCNKAVLLGAIDVAFEWKPALLKSEY
jgi:hypothetical protein